MANGFNPYGIATTQQNLVDNLLTAQQSKQLGESETKKQTGEMTEDFERELIAEQKRQQEILNKKRKKGWLEKLMPAISFFAGPLAGGILSGLTGMVGLGKEKKHLLSQASALGGGNLGGKWGKTFLGSSARTAQAETDSLVDQIQGAAKDISDMDFLTTGIAEGIKGYSAGKTGANVMDAIGTGELAKGLTEDQITKLGESKITDVAELAKSDLFKGVTEDQLTELMKSNLVGADAPILKAIFGEQGLGKAPSTLLKDGGEGQNILKNLLMLLSQGRG